MDRGAHFFKCDFQVHTPRDTRWSGGDAVTDAERKAYAEELILACRQLGLGAIAVTDHHDLAFFPFVRRAALDELDDQGRPVPVEDRIVVFPGIEMTLTAPACQAILILDAAFPDNLLESVLTALAITPAPSTQSREADPQRIPQNVVGDLGALYETLNSHQHIRGRYIVFPNVSENGHGTLLRSGFGNFYKAMPCVGGYVDGSVSQLGKGNAGIVAGMNRDYGFKSIAVFQTSDNRRRDHADLGKHITWVKWSEPTAEALRQACLAKESRLSQDEPILPGLWITSMNVSNSKFLGRIDVDFNRQYNAVIGGRGTGKSTILEYLRWGLCDQQVDDPESEAASVQVRRRKLIEDTLKAVDGEVIVTFLLNDVEHIIKRNSKTSTILLRIGAGQFAPATEQEVRNLFPVQAYSQKQLSSVGVRIEELKRFVELPVKQTLDKIRSELHSTAAVIRTAYGSLVRKRELEAEAAKYGVEIASLAEQVAKLRESLKGLSKEDQDTISQKAKYDNEVLIVEGLNGELDRVRALVKSLEGGGGKVGDLAEEIHNTTLVESIRNKYRGVFSEIDAQVKVLSGVFESKAAKALEDEVVSWQKATEAFEARYEEAKSKAKTNQRQLQDIRNIEKRVAELKKADLERRGVLVTLAGAEATYADARTRWNELHDEKLGALNAQCERFSGLSDGLIRAKITGGVDVELLKQELKTAFSKLNVREQKVEELCQCVFKSRDPMKAWSELLGELETLSLHGGEQSKQLPTTPVLNGCGLVDSEKKRLAAGFDSARWLTLSLVELEFNPIFLYCTNKSTNEFIAFADASAGQQATALLTVLLNQTGAPLVIDQPEDDVDSKMTSYIVQQIWRSKSSRQLIFSSHSANFVVNGDAELVMCCDYVRAGDQTGGQIKVSGAIDNAVIKSEITAVTEGGEAAFKLRKDKYGF